jgi:hypothetical protein
MTPSLINAKLICSFHSSLQVAKPLSLNHPQNNNMSRKNSAASQIWRKRQFWGRDVKASQNHLAYAQAVAVPGKVPVEAGAAAARQAVRWKQGIFSMARAFRLKPARPCGERASPFAVAENPQYFQKKAGKKEKKRI